MKKSVDKKLANSVEKLRKKINNLVIMSWLKTFQLSGGLTRKTRQIN